MSKIATPKVLVLIALGAIVGTWLRELISQAMPVDSSGLPTGILVVNLTGTLVLGILASVFTHFFHGSRNVRLALGTGLLGAYTTFSTLEIALVELTRSGHGWIALDYLVASVIGGILVGWAGFQLTNLLVGRFKPATKSEHLVDIEPLEIFEP